MKRYILLLTTCIVGTYLLGNNQAQQDSLLIILKTTHAPAQRILIYQNLVDLNHEKPLEIAYLKQFYEEARKSKRMEDMFEAIGSLSLAYLKQDKVDSCYYYVKQMQAYDKDKFARDWTAYIAMRLFNYYTYQPDDLGFKINDKLKEMEEQSKPYSKDVYQQIKQSFILGLGLFTQEKMQEAIPYLKNATELAEKLPLKEGFKVVELIKRLYGTSLALNQENPKTIELEEQLLAMEENFYKLYCAKDRPFFPINSYYARTYTTLMINVSFLPVEKQQKYMKQILEHSKTSSSDTDKYNYFLSLNNYYLYLKDNRKALESNDSLIKIAYKIAPYNLTGLYQLNSTLYANIKQYSEAYNALRKSYAVKDSLSTIQMQEELNKLQVQYQVDKLIYEKTELQNKSSLIITLALGTVLTIVIGICVYLFKNLKREKRLKQKLNVLKLKAEESENMKIAFINSMCHEIRTPLNAIVGFTDIILDDSIDMEMRQTFPAEIQHNTFLLTSLVNSMLEVSNLDVSDAPLPCEPVNINHLFSTKMDKLIMQKKDGIEYHLNMPDEEVMVSTNQRYLGLVIENLLDNANKFTEQGEISLHFHIKNGYLRINVSDTGCGIPIEKQQDIFGRFVKLDDYKQGNGLGLYLCKIIIKRLSGEIFVDSSYSDGARFCISLPISS